MVAKAPTTLQAAPADAEVTMTIEAEAGTKVSHQAVHTTTKDEVAPTVVDVEAETTAVAVAASQADLFRSLAPDLDRLANSFRTTSSLPSTTRAWFTFIPLILALSVKTGRPRDQQSGLPTTSSQAKWELIYSTTGSFSACSRLIWNLKYPRLWLANNLS